MSDARDRSLVRLRELDSIRSPDLWSEIAFRRPGPELRPPRRPGRVLATIVTVAVVSASVSFGAVILSRSGRSATGPVPSPTAGPLAGSGCELRPWTKRCPEADWIRAVLAEAGYQVTEDTGSALIARAGDTEFAIWATDAFAGPPEVESLEAEVDRGSYRFLRLIDSTPVYTDGVRTVWRPPTQFVDVWTSIEHPINRTAIPEDVLGTLVHASFWPLMKTSFDRCPTVDELVPVRSGEDEQILQAVRAYYEEERATSPDLGVVWGLTDRWYHAESGWLQPADIDRDQSLSVGRGSEFYRYEIFAPKRPEDVLQGGPDALAFFGVSQFCSPGQLEELRSAWRWVAVGHPDCACLSGAQDDVLLIHRPEGYRILVIR